MASFSSWISTKTNQTIINQSTMTNTTQTIINQSTMTNTTQTL